MCSDVDECSSLTTACDVNAVCINTIGSYECVCGDGYAGDGMSCEGEDCNWNELAVTIGTILLDDR